MNPMYSIVEESLNRVNAMFPTMLSKLSQQDRIYVFEQWASQLKDLPPAAVAKAFGHIIKTHKPKFYGDNPVVADVLDYIAQNTGPSWEVVLQECFDKAYRVLNPDKRFSPDSGEYEAIPTQFNSKFSELVFSAAGGAGIFTKAKIEDPVFRSQFRNTLKEVRLGLIGSGGWIQATKTNVVMISEAKSVKRLPDAPVHPEIAEKMEKSRLRLEQMRERFGERAAVDASINHLNKNNAMPKGVDRRVGNG